MQWPTRRSSAFSIMSSKSHQSSWDDGDVINPALGDGDILQPVQRGGSSGSSMLANYNFSAFGNYFVRGYCHLLAVKTTKWCALIPPVIRTGFEGGCLILALRTYVGPWWNHTSIPSMGLEFYNLLHTEIRLLDDLMKNLLKQKRRLHFSLFPFFTSQSPFYFLGEVPFIVFPKDLSFTESRRATQWRKTVLVIVTCPWCVFNTAQRTFCHWHIGIHFTLCSRKMLAGPQPEGDLFAAFCAAACEEKGLCHPPLQSRHRVKWTPG